MSNTRVERAISVATGRGEQVIARVREVLLAANARYGINLNPSVDLRMRGRVAGKAGMRTVIRASGARETHYSLKFNRDLILGDHFEDMLREVIPHEIAHLVTYARPDLGDAHNRGWQRVCMALGGTGKTYHDYSVNYAHGGFTYRASCGTLVTVSKIIHKRLQSGQQTRTLRATGGRISRTSPWAPEGKPVPELRVAA
jgi:SprT protein